MKLQPATKTNSFVKLALAGPAGSGKTYSALSIATHLSDKRIAVIDAEPGCASKYADIFQFDKLELALDDFDRDIEKAFSPQRYKEAIKKVYDTGDYDVLIIDGISQEWDDDGGVLQWVDEMTKRNKSDGEKAAVRNAWSVATPVHRDFVNYILRVRMHVICTMRAKKETVAMKDADGYSRKVIVLDPIQREDVPYVFDVMGIMDKKEMRIDKTRCSALDDKMFVRPGKEFALLLREWIKGNPMPERPEYDPDIQPLMPSNGPSASAVVPTQAIEDIQALAETMPPVFFAELLKSVKILPETPITSLTLTQANSLLDSYETWYETPLHKVLADFLAAQQQTIIKLAPEIDEVKIKEFRATLFKKTQGFTIKNGILLSAKYRLIIETLALSHTCVLDADGNVFDKTSAILEEDFTKPILNIFLKENKQLLENYRGLLLDSLDPQFITADQALHDRVVELKAQREHELAEAQPVAVTA